MCPWLLTRRFLIDLPSAGVLPWTGTTSSLLCCWRLRTRRALHPLCGRTELVGFEAVGCLKPLKHWNPSFGRRCALRARRPAASDWSGAEDACAKPSDKNPAHADHFCRCDLTPGLPQLGE